MLRGAQSAYWARAWASRTLRELADVGAERAGRSARHVSGRRRRPVRMQAGLKRSRHARDSRLPVQRATRTRAPRGVQVSAAAPRTGRSCWPAPRRSTLRHEQRHLRLRGLALKDASFHVGAAVERRERRPHVAVHRRSAELVCGPGVGRRSARDRNRGGDAQRSDAQPSADDSEAHLRRRARQRRKRAARSAGHGAQRRVAC